MSSTSEHISQRQQQLYYSNRSPRVSLVGTSTASSPVMLSNTPQVRGNTNQVVVVSGDNQFRSIPIGSVGYHPPGCACPNCETKYVPPIGHSTSLDNRHEIYTYSIANDPSGNTDGIVQEFTTENGERHVFVPSIHHSTSLDNRQELISRTSDDNKRNEKSEKEAVKRARQAEAARLRYHRLTPDEKKALNLKRTLAQKRKKQREKEMAQLEAILRASGDIYDDPEVLEQLREKRMRAKWAEAARNRYHRSMTDEERKSHNMKRRIKQQVSVKNEDKSGGNLGGEANKRIKEQNARKAEAARLRYHRMTYDEKKLYNQRRTEAFRRRRMEEETLLAMPIGRINGEALDRAQQIVIRNAKRAEAARLRYQRMTPEQRRAYNQKRYTPKRKRQIMEVILADVDPDLKTEKSDDEEEYDALSSLERDVLRRTQQAHQILLLMSTSEQSSQRHQQLYYSNRTPNSRVSLVGTSAASSPVMLSNTPQVRGNANQVVVVSGDNQFRSIPIGNVGYHPPGCACPNCETKFDPTSLGNSHEFYTYIGNDQSNDDDDGIVEEFTTGSGERHVVIMTKNDANLSMQEKLRRQKLSEAARNRYALLSDDEKRIFTERRIIMRQRKKQKEREMEELEAILRATNDITDDLVLLDEQSLQRKRARLSRYQTMSIDERREYNQKRRLKQLGLPENIEEVPRQKLEQIKRHINEVNARKAEAARQRYHRMTADERKIYNRRRTESFRKRRVEEEKLLSTPAGQITPEALEKAQSIMLRNAKRAEQARLRYQRKQQERGVVPRRQRKPKTEITNESTEPNLDQILDTIERDVVRKTEEARQTLLKMQQNELKKEETVGTLDDKQHHFVVPDRGGGTTHTIVQSPINITQQQLSGGNVVQYVQVPARSVQNGFIIADNKFVQVHTDGGIQTSGPQSYTVKPQPQNSMPAQVVVEQ
uniref:Uncharacterized protein n=1 Tax=Meloidogyne javanica TaxID=6303 RepID=A0A915LGG9_MELJA